MSPAEKLIKFSFASPSFFSSKLLSMRRRQKPEEKDGGEKREGGEEGWTCIVASTDRSKSADSDMEVVLGEEARNDR